MIRLLYWVLVMLVAASPLTQGQTLDQPAPEGMDERPPESGAFDDRDPWESYNRRIHNFNQVLDRNVLRPTAQAYKKFTPETVNGSISNFFANLGEIGNITNSLLQAKGEQTLVSTARLVFNSTFGVLGLFDVASQMDLQQRNEDFGQTLGYWGVSSGPYTVLPILGPSTVRDTGGMGVDFFAPDGWSLIGDPESYYLRLLAGIDLRAELISFEDQITGDRYTFLRNTYLQSRQFRINDGRIEDDPFADREGEDLMLDDF